MKINKKAVSAGSSAAPSSRSGEYIVAIGRRKVATARVRLYKGKGASMVNEKPVRDYFASVDPLGVGFDVPFKAVDAVGLFSVTAKVEGSGLQSQLDAVVHGISRALVKLNPEYRALLKKSSLLTRDSRMKESRKIGTGGKARRQKQSPKR